MRTLFCDIDGTLLEHFGNVQDNLVREPRVLPGVLDALRAWDKANYFLVLTTGRKESARNQTEEQLRSYGISWDVLVMGLPNGDRVLLNDKKQAPNHVRNTAYAINVPRNEGLVHVDPTGDLVTLPNRYLPTSGRIEKPWGYEELVDVNDRYVVKKLFMKAAHACSIQYHKLKRETILVFSGSLRIYTGTDAETLSSRIYTPGETITIEPYTVHRMEAVEDAIYYETSTNELWDVVRLQDAYGRV